MKKMTTRISSSELESMFRWSRNNTELVLNNSPLRLVGERARLKRRQKFSLSFEHSRIPLVSSERKRWMSRTNETARGTIPFTRNHIRPACRLWLSWTWQEMSSLVRPQARINTNLQSWVHDGMLQTCINSWQKLKKIPLVMTFRIWRKQSPRRVGSWDLKLRDGQSTVAWTDAKVTRHTTSDQWHTRVDRTPYTAPRLQKNLHAPRRGEVGRIDHCRPFETLCALLLVWSVNCRVACAS